MSYQRYHELTGRSKKAYDSDVGKLGKLTTNINKWKKNPRKYDYYGIDTPEQPKKYIKRYNTKRKHRKRNHIQHTYKYK